MHIHGWICWTAINDNWFREYVCEARVERLQEDNSKTERNKCLTEHRGKMKIKKTKTFGEARDKGPNCVFKFQLLHCVLCKLHAWRFLNAHYFFIYSHSFSFTMLDYGYFYDTGVVCSFKIFKETKRNELNWQQQYYDFINQSSCPY